MLDSPVFSERLEAFPQLGNPTIGHLDWALVSSYQPVRLVLLVALQSQLAIRMRSGFARTKSAGSESCDDELVVGRMYAMIASSEDDGSGRNEMDQPSMVSAGLLGARWMLI